MGYLLPHVGAKLHVSLSISLVLLTDAPTVPSAPASGKRNHQMDCIYHRALGGLDFDHHLPNHQNFGRGGKAISKVALSLAWIQTVLRAPELA